MISIIIPAYDEAGRIAETIGKIRERQGSFSVEIIVADGGSNDATIGIAENCGDVKVIRSRKGRAIQMNEGAKMAKGEILYFLHADTIPPQDFTLHILQACGNQAAGGCFRLAFDVNHWFLRVHCWFTRFDINAVRFGDQSLFVLKNVFIKCGGFREDLMIMEDQEIIHRMKKFGKFSVLNATVTTSARKYSANGIYRMQAIFYRIWLSYHLGYSQRRLMELHRRLIKKQME